MTSFAAGQSFHPETYSILIVDDDQQVCRIIQDLFNREGYRTRTAENGQIALGLINEALPDLVISDIQMPVMDGFELFLVLRKQYPAVKHIMMTSFDIDQYIEHMRRYNIGNVLAKGSDFNLAEVSGYVRAILSGDIFGIERYFPGVAAQQIKVESYQQAKSMYSQIITLLPGKKGFFLEIALDELLSNAIFHGALNSSDLPREMWLEDTPVPEDHAVFITWCADNNKIGVSVEDRSGKLKKTEVLKWLDTYHRAQEGDEHGRGLFLVRKLLDRLIVNISPDQRTECIVIQYFNRDDHHYNKPLLIHEV